MLISIFTHARTIDLTIQPSGNRLRRDNSEYGSFVGPLARASGLRVEFYVVTKWNPSHGTPEECTSEEFDRWTASCEDYLQGVRKAERLFYRAHGRSPASAVSRFLRRSLMRLPGKHLRSYRARRRCEFRLSALACRHYDIQRELLDRRLDTTGEEAEEIASETLPPLYRSRTPARRQSAAHRGRRKRRKRT